MAEWKGFDPGGTEQLWRPDILLDMVSVCRENEPFSRNDPSSPIFDRLEELHPETTWRNVNADGSFRPIFRKANPLVKLGLTTPEPFGAFLTDLGNDLVEGNISVSEVFKIAAANHQERDGSRSMALMCQAALEEPSHEFSLAEVEYGIARIYEPGNNSVSEVLQQFSRVGGAQVPAVRARRLKNFMDALCTAEAMLPTATGYVLMDASVAQAISEGVTHNSVVGIDANKSKSDAIPTIPDPKEPKVARTNAGQFKSVSGENRLVAPFDLKTPKLIDGAKRALLLERANQSHENTVQKLAIALTKMGLDPFEDRDSFDIAVFSNQPSMFEVKSVNYSNVVSQLRKGIIQLMEYHWRHHELFQSAPKPFLVFDTDPRKFLNSEYFEFANDMLNTEIIWPSEFGFVDRHGQELETVLFPEN